MQSSPQSTPRSSYLPHLEPIGTLILDAGATRAALVESIAAVEAAFAWFGVVEPVELAPLREACAVFALLSVYAPEVAPGRCDCGAALAYVTGAGVSGVLCPECDAEHYHELVDGLEVRP